MPYEQLSYEDRILIAHLKKERLGVRAIARRMGRSASTISRELARNGPRAGSYGAVASQDKTAGRRKRAYVGRRKLDHIPLAAQVEQWLRLIWSPAIIEAKLKIHYPKAPKMRVSRQTIYNWVWEQREDLIPFLWINKRRWRKKYGSADKRGQIVDRVPIEKRPKSADNRSRYGHWEGDTIEGAKHRGYVGSFVERKSRLVLLTPLPNKRSETLNAGLAHRMKSVPKKLRRTITLDNGKEFADHKGISAKTNLEVFFARPYASWQRGLNEQTNKLVRRFLPKGMDFIGLTKAQVAKVERALNNRPRKCLGYRSPMEVYQALLSKQRSGVALRV